MQDTWKTPLAAQQLAVSYCRLFNLIRYGKVPPPRKDSSGDYVWTNADLSRARAALAGRLQQGKGQ
jgi:hypothetical protein